MTKEEIKIVVDELREGKYYNEIDISPMSGCGLPNFKKGKMIRKEVIVMHLRWQCININGDINEVELSYELQLLKDNKIIMV